MPFTNAVKEELIAGLPKKPCCRRSFLYGILCMRGSTRGDAGQVFLDGDGVFELTEKLIVEQFSRETRRMKRQDAVSLDMLCFSSASAAEYIRSLDAGVDALLAHEKCNGCRK